MVFTELKKVILTSFELRNHTNFQDDIFGKYCNQSIFAFMNLLFSFELCNNSN